MVVGSGPSGIEQIEDGRPSSLIGPFNDCQGGSRIVEHTTNVGFNESPAFDQIAVGDFHLIPHDAERFVHVGFCRLNRHFCLANAALVAIEEEERQSQIESPLLRIVRPLRPLNRIASADGDIGNPVGLG
jgi:hypothetical protein